MFGNPELRICVSQGSKKEAAMSEDEMVRRPVNPFRIELKDEDDVEYWTERLGVDRECLERAIRCVGNGPEAVTHHLKGRRN